MIADDATECDLDNRLLWLACSSFCTKAHVRTQKKEGTSVQIDFNAR